MAEQEGGTDVVAPALLEVDGLLRPPGLRLLLPQAQPIRALSSAPAQASPGRSDRGSAHHEMRAVLVVREGGERALGRGGAAAPRAEAHRALELAPDRILPPPARVSQSAAQSPWPARRAREPRREMALFAERGGRRRRTAGSSFARASAISRLASASRIALATVSLCGL